MNNTTLQVKIKQRMNKIDSQDYDNIKSWEIAEAFNKAQLEWCRRQLAGTNIRKEGDEMSKRRIDDLSILLTRKKLVGVDIQYNDTYGYFQSSNFGSIYDPQQGGDYLEFKKIECNSQQCFPFINATTTTGIVENESTIPGYWQTNYETVITNTPGGSEEITTSIRNVPIFGFYTHGSPSGDFIPSQNRIEDWGEYGDPNQPFWPGIPATQITTNEPWVFNNNLFPPIIFDNGAGNVVYNNNIIMPILDSAGPITGCNYCGLTGSEIINNENLLQFFAEKANANVGYVIGGPNNELLDFTQSPAILSSIPDLSAQAGGVNGVLNEQYPYTNAPNNWINNTIQLFDVQTDALCASSGCWFVPSSVQFQTFSISNWETIPGSTDINIIETDPTYIPDQTITYETEETIDVPFQKCYCAPGADKERFCIKPRTMTVYQSEVANVDLILRDPLKRPDFDWCETFCTLESNQDNNNNPAIRIWRKDFFIMDPVLVYYRVPRRVEILGSVDPYNGADVLVDVECEFKDDIVELLIDYTASILAGDISDANQMIRGEQQGEKNN